MDYPKSTPGVGLVGGRFVDENITTGQPGSLIPAVWGNAVTNEILEVILAGGLVPDEHDLGQLARAIRAQIAWDNLKGKAILSSDTAGNTYEDAALQIREAKEIGGANLGDSYSPSIWFHWATKVAGRLSMDSNATLRWRGEPLLTTSALDGLNEYLEQKADKATTLGGYGVPFASQLDATTGTDTEKPMSALRVFQAIAAKVVQATEVVQGVLRIATQPLVDGGADDTTAVTPKKLKVRMDTKADKATTLGGYGVPFASQLDATTGTDTEKPMSAMRVFQAIGARVVQATELVQGVMRIATQGLVDEGVDDTTAVTPKKLKGRLDTKADKATTLGGYGVPFASQLDATTGTDTAKPMSALRTFQAITAKVVQATEAVQGVARIATQQEVDAGADDLTMVTPKKLRWGFQALLASNGYIVFPSWLGGLVLQWGSVGFNSFGVKTFTYPIMFPNFALRGIAVLSDSSIYSFGSNPFASVAVDSSNRTSAQVQSTYATLSSVTVFVIGN